MRERITEEAEVAIKKSFLSKNDSGKREGDEHRQQRGKTARREPAIRSRFGRRGFFRDRCNHRS